jgi:hypothetical protein
MYAGNEHRSGVYFKQEEVSKYKKIILLFRYLGRRNENIFC